MKKVLSISLGSSKRDHRVETDILGEKFIIERKGTDGDKKKAARLFAEYDGKYDAFGMGGIDLYIYSGKNRYAFRDARKLIKDVKKTPTVDGSGLKNSLERKVVRYLYNEMGLDFEGKNVLMVSAMDRFGMAETFNELGANIVFGDLIFCLGVPVSIKSLKTLDILARVVAPVVTMLPFELVYPTGDKQNSGVNKKKYWKYYNRADIIAGDFHYIKRYMPERLDNKIIITNTVTRENIEELKRKGVAMLVTTTPNLNGRSFGTNVMEGVLVALSGKQPDEMTTSDYLELLDKIGFKPTVFNFKEDQ
ncbi:hypothetical protein [Halothermothrix orenii]|uniref:Quinate 5-dehydrogenase n=1 Tax=Halothermothrix orenii (strain H 168 / OCM 544 / DSM 9562) TaxID=373903 RepID=B8D079_HALOH|nr:hypothetical protein [Halothermothrix orenii]ACL68833.1 hypothetical protein Hore_00720 [Halothermothrix orenii H 168]